MLALKGNIVQTLALKGNIVSTIALQRKIVQSLGLKGTILLAQTPMLTGANTWLASGYLRKHISIVGIIKFLKVMYMV